MFSQSRLDSNDPNYDPVEARIQEYTDPNNPLKDGGRFARLSHEAQRAEVILELEREEGHHLYELLHTRLWGMSPDDFDAFDEADPFTFEGNGRTYVARPDPKSRDWFPRPIKVSTGSSSFVLGSSGDITLEGGHKLQEVDREAYKKLVGELNAFLKAGQKEKEEVSEAERIEEGVQATREVLSDFLGE